MSEYGGIYDITKGQQGEMKTFYKVNIRTVKDEEGTPIPMYGIDAVSSEGIVQNSIVDAFDTCDKADKLAKVCTDLELAPEHLPDVVEDNLNV